MDVTVYFNTHPDHFLGYEPGQPLQKVFSYEAPTSSTLFRLADEALQAFNAPLELAPPAYRDLAKAYWAAGNRPLTVGDVLKIGHSWLVCASTSWIALAEAPAEVHDD